MMSESIDETLDKDEAEEETEELTNQVNINNQLLNYTACYYKYSLFLIFSFYSWQVLDEIGVDIASQVGFGHSIVFALIFSLL